MSVIKNLRSLSKMEFYHTALVIPCRKNIIREKRKLRKLKRKRVEFRDVYTSYLSFRGNIKRYNSYRIVNSLDRYFSSIYGEEMENISVGDRYGRKNQRTGE